VSLYEPGADEHLADVDVRGNPGLVYRIHRDFAPSEDQRLALGWSEGGCEYTVLFAPSVAAEEVIDFAPRY